MTDADATPPLQAPTTSGRRTTKPAVDGRVSQIATLLKSLDEIAVESGQSATRAPLEYEDRLVRERLGIAGGLFNALRCKHAPTGSHCLRVAIGCSAWAMALEIPSNYREALEVAALLHDIGKIGVPERILLKPGKLLPDEEAIVATHSLMAVEILSACCTNHDVLDIVSHGTTWYDGSRNAGELTKSDLPLGARMLAIVDAFDAMTTDQIFRPAKSRERALAELFAFAGKQFDPELVKSFHELHSSNPNQLFLRVTEHWLNQFSAQDDSVGWKLPAGDFSADEQSTRSASPASYFESMLVDNMHDGVIFVDTQLRIFVWNTGAERLTGVGFDAANGRHWRPDLLDMRGERGRRLAAEDCPIAKTIDSGVQSIQRLSILGRGGRDVIVDVHAVPVRNEQGTIQGATVLLHDASGEASLEERCHDLHEKATKDPLTQVANRAEFDRMHQLFIDAHLESRLPCSLIISDIDHFKNINDTYGHQAGDEAITSFASLLKGMCRTGDLVARYGGEEFVILCTDCNNAAAARKAEEIRQTVQETKYPVLRNKGFTASFGVTELQPGDTPATMLRRADRALLKAKDQGRNQVVQMGDGMVATKKKRGWWPFGGNGSRRPAAILETNLVTIVPISVAVEKLRGFIADHSATILKTGEDHLQLEVSDDKSGLVRRHDDRAVPFVIELLFEEKHIERANSLGFAAGEYVETWIETTIRPRKTRDRRGDKPAERARMMLASLKSYLMAQDEQEHAKAVAGQSPLGAAEAS